MGEVWTLSEYRDKQLRDVSFELLAWGRKLADQLDTCLCAVVLIEQISEDELNKLFFYGADKVYVVRNPALANFLVEPYARTLKNLVDTYEPLVFLAAATTTGRTVMPYLSMLLHTGLTADCTGLEIEPETDNLLQIRPAIGSNIMATIRTPKTRPQMATVRPMSIFPLEPDPLRQGEILYPMVPAEAMISRMSYEAFIPEGQGTTALEEADIIVSGGRGMQDTANFKLIESLAKALGGSAASSRPPVDLDWQPYIRQVGLTGKTISPALYIACGISGAVQHLAGIQTARNIVAINSDADAPIFQVADFGIVGDLMEILPALIKCLEIG
jgi:electron transfer flavoprotein alpha subunit